MQRLLSSVALLSAALGLTVPSQAASASPVLVRFGPLLWAYSAGGNPYLRPDGQIAVPVEAMCDLFGAKCQVDLVERRVRVDQAGQVSQVALTEVKGTGANRVGFVNLKQLAAPLGLTVAWDSISRSANVSRTSTTPGGLSYFQGQLSETDVPAQPLQGPALTRVVAPPGRAYGQLFFTATRNQLHGLSLFARLPNGTTNVTGTAVPSTPDVKNAPVPCTTGTPSTCSVVVDLTTLYALAAVSTAH